MWTKTLSLSEQTQKHKLTILAPPTYFEIFNDVLFITVISSSVYPVTT